MKKLFLIYPVFLFATLFAFTSCDDRTDAEKAADNIEEAGENMKDAFRSDREELAADIEEAREDVNDRIEELREDLNDATDESRAAIERQMERLEVRKNELDNDLERLGDNIADGWNEFKKDVRTSLRDAREEINEAF